MTHWDERQHALGVAEMDAMHQEFLDLAAVTERADDSEFAPRFRQLVEHTRLHFAQEGRLMRQCGFRAIGEHEGEHARVLGELLQFNRAVGRGRIALARAYVKQGLPAWFDLHLSTMDAALAAHYRMHQPSP
jgi:hemerythrin-like metal-binding protein